MSMISVLSSSGPVAPSAPTIGTATAGNASASITFTAPTFTGRSTITSYTVTSSPGGFTGTGASSPITVSGLSNGTAYTFTVTATNAAGRTSPASSASNSVTPALPTYALVLDVNSSTTYTIPAGKTVLAAFVRGGGASGAGGGLPPTNAGQSGGNGGRGSYAAGFKDLTVSAGEVYTITVGGSNGASTVSLGGTTYVSASPNAANSNVAGAVSSIGGNGGTGGNNNTARTTSGNGNAGGAGSTGTVISQTLNGLGTVNFAPGYGGGGGGGGSIRNGIGGNSGGAGSPTYSQGGTGGSAAYVCGIWEPSPGNSGAAGSGSTYPGGGGGGGGTWSQTNLVSGPAGGGGAGSVGQIRIYVG